MEPDAVAVCRAVGGEVEVAGKRSCRGGSGVIGGRALAALTP